MRRPESAWFAGVGPGGPDAAAAAIRESEADEPRDLPALAVESGFAEDVYSDRLHEAIVDVDS